jgi:hypothetical protein
MCIGVNKGSLNRANYFSKHHPATHHQQFDPRISIHQLIGQNY